jgi:hypothetical protein
VYVAAIYLSLPFARPALDFLYSTVGGEALGVILNAVLFGAAALTLLASSRLGARRSALIALPLLALAVPAYLLEKPEERVHFLEYGVLGFLLVRACARGGRGVAAALFLAVLAGTVDEFIQLLLPDRVGDMRDVAMNAGGGALGVWTGKLWHL